MEHIYLFNILFLFPLTVYPEVELLDHTIDLSLIVLGTFNLCSIRAKPIYIPTRVYKHSLFSTFSQHFSLLGYRLSNRGEVISDCDFEIHFPDDYWCWVSFPIPGDHLEIFFVKCLFCSSAHSLIEFCCMSCAYILDLNPSFNMWLQNFSSIL